MDKFLIRGGKPLKGKVEISGAKNSALPCLAATLLSAETVTLHNVPYVKDLITQRRLLEDLGATVLTPELRTHKVSAANVEIFEAPYDLVKTMRVRAILITFDLSADIKFVSFDEKIIGQRSVSVNSLFSFKQANRDASVKKSFDCERMNAELFC